MQRDNSADSQMAAVLNSLIHMSMWTWCDWYIDRCSILSHSSNLCRSSLCAMTATSPQDSARPCSTWHTLMAYYSTSRGIRVNILVAFSCIFVWSGKKDGRTSNQSHDEQGFRRNVSRRHLCPVRLCSCHNEILSLVLINSHPTVLKDNCVLSPFIETSPALWGKRHTVALCDLTWSHRAQKPLRKISCWQDKHQADSQMSSRNTYFPVMCVSNNVCLLHICMWCWLLLPASPMV